MSDLRRCAAPDCDNDFSAKRSTKRFCTNTCQKRAARARRAAEDNAAEEAKTDTPAEHALVAAARKELETAGALDTVPGQLALQIARRIVMPDCSGISAMSKEMRALLAEAKGVDGTPDVPAEPTPAEDEVTKARRQREESREAAGLA